MKKKRKKKNTGIFARAIFAFVVVALLAGALWYSGIFSPTRDAVDSSNQDDEINQPCEPIDEPRQIHLLPEPLSVSGVVQDIIIFDNELFLGVTFEMLKDSVVEFVLYLDGVRHEIVTDTVSIGDDYIVLIYSSHDLETIDWGDETIVMLMFGFDVIEDMWLLQFTIFVPFVIESAVLHVGGAA